MAPDWTAACQSWICSPCCKSCVYGICAFVLRCFFSVLTLYSPMEHSLGVNFFFPSSLSSCKCCIFLTYPVFLFCLPRCHMYVVYVWTGGWLISMVLVTSDNKGLLLLLLLNLCSDIKCYKKHILTTVNNQIPHVIAKGIYYKHSMVV